MQRAAGVASARRFPHANVVPHGMHARPDAVTTGHATLPCDHLPGHRGRAARHASRFVPRRIVSLWRSAVQTVGDDACRSISIGCAHDADRPCAGSRLK
ncbi:hypothetical protein BSLA_01f0644 [Burkholderia stabilis]|nr:hypothetical protein BSLA_01f0644 [Burkholderia stabilis]